MFIQDLPVSIKERRICEVFDDFINYNDAQLWTKYVTAVGGESVAEATGNNAVGGILAITTGGTASNEAAVNSTNKLFCPAKNQPMHFECFFNYADSHSHDASMIFGFADIFGATGALTAAGAALKSSWNGFAFYKLSTQTLWSVASSITTTPTTNVTNVTIDDGSGSASHVFRIDVQPVDGTNVEVTFWIDGAQCVDNSSGKPIKHLIAYAAFAKLNVGFFNKAGTANSETVNLDYISAFQLIRQTML